MSGSDIVRLVLFLAVFVFGPTIWVLCFDNGTQRRDFIQQESGKATTPVIRPAKPANGETPNRRMDTQSPPTQSGLAA